MSSNLKHVRLKLLRRASPHSHTTTTRKQREQPQYYAQNASRPFWGQKRALLRCHISSRTPGGNDSERLCHRSQLPAHAQHLTHHRHRRSPARPITRFRSYCNSVTLNYRLEIMISIAPVASGSMMNHGYTGSSHTARLCLAVKIPSAVGFKNVTDGVP
ncbi:hypothetical protein EX30DRAFT_133936 [Ascodesmis nigricans]|uniref:Uncharacterized protein n=1 Tax=Ascodesmis nigricans TaxID=341454 RepID=A0A4S2MNN6_9PEZI|nr:hypothetical protein EX30DRAFT_133936 [Ascodesmis nigricans]